MSGTFALKAVIAFYLANFLAVISTTIYLHRGLTHGAVEYPKWLERAFRIFLWIFTSIFCRDWVGVHRHHHAYADVEGDPHSPWIFGFWQVQFWNVALYSEATRDRQMIDQHTRDIPMTMADRIFFRRGWLGLLIGMSIFYLIFGWAGVLGFVVSGLVYVFVQSSTVNGLGHYPSHIGFQNYHEKYAEKAWNLRIPTLFNVLVPWRIGGEELHNNHHGDPKSASFAHYPDKGEFDFGWMVIGLLKRAGLATQIHEPKVWKGKTDTNAA